MAAELTELRGARAARGRAPAASRRRAARPRLPVPRPAGQRHGRGRARAEPRRLLGDRHRVEARDAPRPLRAGARGRGDPHRAGRATCCTTSPCGPSRRRGACTSCARRSGSAGRRERLPQVARGAAGVRDTSCCSPTSARACCRRCSRAASPSASAGCRPRARGRRAEGGPAPGSTSSRSPAPRPGAWTRRGGWRSDAEARAWREQLLGLVHGRAVAAPTRMRRRPRRRSCSASPRAGPRGGGAVLVAERDRAAGRLRQGEQGHEPREAARREHYKALIPRRRRRAELHELRASLDVDRDRAARPARASLGRGRRRSSSAGGSPETRPRPRCSGTRARQRDLAARPPYSGDATSARRP